MRKSNAALLVYKQRDGQFFAVNLKRIGYGLIAERDPIIHRVIFNKRLYLCRAFFIKRNADDFKTA